MKSVVDLGSDIHAILEGHYTFFPRFKLMRMRALEWKEEKLQQHVHDDEEAMNKAENKGDVHELDKATRALVKDLGKELKIDKKEIIGEEAIELNVINKIGHVLEILQNEKELLHKMHPITVMVDDFAKDQLNDLADVEQGGRPWEAAIGQTDIGQTSNDAINAIKNLRDDIQELNSVLNEIGKSGVALGTHTDEKRKKGTVDYVTAEKWIGKLEHRIKTKYIPNLKQHFFMMLRLYSFLREEIKHELEHVDVMKEEGLSEKTAKEIQEKLDKMLKKMKDNVAEEKEDANVLVQRATRVESET